jgi:ABC-type transport system substrate-binding protein
LAPVPYDPALSKKLLAEAGHDGGLKVRGYWINTAMGQTVAEAIKSMLAKVGITWEVELLSAKKVSFETVDAMRVANGWIVEHWGVANLYSAMQQLGVMPPLPHK